jgi:hypothetical protein
MMTTEIIAKRQKMSMIEIQAMHARKGLPFPENSSVS